MKRLSALLLTLCLAALLTAPALAYTEYGTAYDATGLLEDAFLRTLGEETFADLSRRCALEFRLDVVRDLEGETIGDYARIFYENYDYGYEDTDDGLLLMVYVTEDGDGLALEEYTLYGEGAGFVFLAEHQEELEAALDRGLRADAWAGDLAADRRAFAAALEAYAEVLEQYAPDDAIETADSGADASSDAAEPHLGFVTDAAGILTEEEQSRLESAAARITEEFSCGVYIVTVSDYTAVASGSIGNVAEAIYRGYDLGYGPERSGILLLMSLADRDFDLVAFGYGNYAFTDYGKEALADEFLDDFRYNDWFDGFSDYLNYSAEFLRRAQGGEPVDWQETPPNPVFLFFASLIPACLIAGVVCAVLRSRMRSVRQASSASAYLVPEGFQLRTANDVFTHITESRVRVRSESTRSGGRGGTSINSGGFSHHSGKF